MESRRRKSGEVFLDETCDSRKEARSALDQLPLNPDLCATCQTIDFIALLFDTSGDSLHRFEHETVYLGTLEDIWHQTLKGCPFCADIAFPMAQELVHDALSTRSASASEPSMDSVFVALVVQNRRFSFPSVAVSHCSKEFYLGIDIRFDTESPPQFASALGTLVRGNYNRYLVTCEQPVCLLDHPLSAYKSLKSRVDRKLCRSWFDMCCGQHEACRQSPRSEGSDSPFQRPHSRKHNDNPFFKFIDVQRREVTAMGNEADYRYATLSYVCGEAYTLCTLKESEDWNQGEDGIWTHPLPMELPNTIEDALVVTANLGLRYLWVDSICIAQDDAEEMQAQILAMHDIYSLSEICIVAASGNNSNHGLPGVRAMRQLPSTAVGVPLRAGKCAVVGPLQPALSNILQRYRWLRRAWTLQEFILARRCLIFTETETFFTCVEGAFRESLVGAYEVSEIFDHFTYISSSLSAAPVFKKKINFGEAVWMYDKVIEEYTRRELTYQEDGLNAFRGLESLIGRRLGCDTIAGCPVPLLSYCLNWRLQSRVCTRDKWPSRRMSRDKRSQKNADDLDRIPLLPSWAWAAWKGAFRFHYDHDHAGTELKVLNPPVFSPILAPDSHLRYNFSLTSSTRGEQEGFLQDTLPVLGRLSRGHFRVACSEVDTGSEEITQDTVVLSTPDGGMVGSCDVRGMLDLTAVLDSQDIAILQLGAGMLPQGAPKYCRILLLEIHDLADFQPALAERLALAAAGSKIVDTISKATVEKDRWLEGELPPEELCELIVPKSVPSSIGTPLLATRVGIGRVNRDVWIDSRPDVSVVFLA